MAIEPYLRDIEPLPGGLARLQARLSPQPRVAWRPIGLAGSAAALMLAVITWLWAEPTIEERRFLSELETVFEQAKAPEVASNGQPLRLIGQTNDGAMFYWGSDIEGKREHRQN